MDEREVDVATVCGNEVRIYGAIWDNPPPRPLLKVLTFPHHGAALLFAQEYDELQQKLWLQRQRRR